MYLPLFAIYFVANSVAVNAFNCFSIRGKEWINTVLLAFFNALAPIVLVIAQYTNFVTTGYTIDGSINAAIVTFISVSNTLTAA